MLHRSPVTPATLALLALSAVILAPRLAAAESSAGEPCIPAALFPTLNVATSPVPANIPAFGYTALGAGPGDVQLFTTMDNAEIPLKFETGTGGLLRLTPTTPLQEETEYLVRYKSFCSSGSTDLSMTFTTTAAAPLPTAFGAFSAPKATLQDDFGQKQFVLEVTWSIAPEMRPWAHVYLPTFEVDYHGQLLSTVDVSPAGDSAHLSVTGLCGELRDGAEHHAHVSVAPPAFDEAFGGELTFSLECPKRSEAPPPFEDNEEVVFDDSFNQTSGPCSFGASAPGRPPGGALTAAAAAVALMVARRRRRR